MSIIEVESKPFDVESIKRSWPVLPDSMIVMEFAGSGDSFFGGTADDRPLGVDHCLLSPPYSRSQIAIFVNIEDAFEASCKISNRRTSSILGVCPAWRSSRNSS